MTNTSLLQQAIKRSGLKMSAIMEVLGIKSYATLRAKISGEREFTAREIMILTELLKLDESEREAIFFAKVSELHSA